MSPNRAGNVLSISSQIRGWGCKLCVQNSIFRLVILARPAHRQPIHIPPRDASAMQPTAANPAGGAVAPPLVEDFAQLNAGAVAVGHGRRWHFVPADWSSVEYFFGHGVHSGIVNSAKKYHSHPPHSTTRPDTISTLLQAVTTMVSSYQVMESREISKAMPL